VSIRHEAKEVAMSLQRLAVILLSAAPVLVVPARAQTPSFQDGDAVTTDLSARTSPSAKAEKHAEGGEVTPRTETSSPARFEGTFTQTRQPAAAGNTRFASSANTDHEITGRLVWTPDEHPGHPKTFGDVDSRFYVPTDGELTVNVKLETRSQAGTCTRDGSKTFAVRALPRAALQNLYLEVAADGRYKIRLGMISYFLPVEAVQHCTFKVQSEARAAAPVNDVGVVIGPQQGSMTDDTLVGATEQPVVYGVHSYSGRWEFKGVD
jgi:hypothetical protein